MKGASVFFIFSLVLSVFCVQAADYRNLVSADEKKVNIGIAGGNKFADVLFLNPSEHRTVVKYEEFDQYLPPRDVDNRSTYDEEKAKVRLFFKPGMRAWGTMRRRAYLVGEGRWKLEQCKEGLKYSRRWKRDSNQIISEVFVRMSEDKAEVVVEAVFTNRGRSACQVEFAPQISFLRGRDLFLMIPRLHSNFDNGKQNVFFYGEKVRLDNSKGRNYFWRQASKDDPAGFIDYVSRERIPFSNPNVDRVNVFGFVQLAGKNSLIWDFQSKDAQVANLQYLECGWEERLGDAVTAWSINLKRGESKKIRFRIITVKGISRFDAVNDNMIVGYSVEKDLLNIEMVPLKPVGVSSLSGKVINFVTRSNLIEQKSEIAEMHPFSAGGKSWRAPAQVFFERGTVYPIKMSLHSSDGKLLLQSDGIIVP